MDTHNIMEQQIINILKRSRQELVFLDSIICPVRKILDGDYKAVRAMSDKMKERGVIKYYAGFISCAYSDYPLIVTSWVLTEEFFNNYCRTGEQLTLF